MPPSVVGGMADSGGPSNNWDQCAAGAIRHTYGYTERIQTYNNETFVTRYVNLQYVTRYTRYLVCSLKKALRNTYGPYPDISIHMLRLQYITRYTYYVVC